MLLKAAHMLYDGMYPPPGGSVGRNTMSRAYPGQYQWDGEGRMVAVDGVAGQACQPTWTACYVYNALGQRVEKRVGSAYTEYMFDPAGQVIGTHDRTYVAQRLFRLNGRPIAIHRDSNTKFPHGNALGSTMFVTNHYGVTDQKTLYAPYGELIAQAGAAARDPRFAGMEQRDAETDFDPTPARFYQNRLYRWMSPDDFTGGPVDAITASLGGADPTPPGPLPYADILNPQSLNKYAYAYNNPLRYIDPTGHDALWVVNKDTGKVTLLVPVHFTGASATPEAISRIVTMGNSLNTGGSGVDVKFVPTDTPINGVLNRMDYSPGYDHAKYGSAGEGTNKLGGNKAHINSELGEAEGAAKHDVLHFAGIKDRYTEGKPDAQGNRTSTADPGYDESNAMVSRTGTNLNQQQMKEAEQNKSTKTCLEGKGTMVCR